MTLDTLRAELILTRRYPHLPAPPHTPPELFAVAVVGLLAADLRAEQRGDDTVPPITQQELDAATVLIGVAGEGLAYAELLISAAQRGRGATWADIAAHRRYSKVQAAQTRQARLQERFGIPDHELPAPPTLAAHADRARRLVETATADRPLSPHLASLAIDTLSVLLLAAAHDHATGADLRDWIRDPHMIGVLVGLDRIPREQAPAAHRILDDTTGLPEGTRGDLNAVLLAAIDVWDPPTTTDTPKDSDS